MNLIKQEDKNALNAIKFIATGNEKQAETLVNVELAYLDAAARTLPAILECEPITIATALRNVLKNNLSLDPYAGLVYVKTRSFKTEGGEWKKSLEIEPTANGRLSIARQSGRILDFKNPKVIYNDKDQVVGVKFEILVPSYNSPRWEEFEYTTADFNRWKKYSHIERSRGKADGDIVKMNYANALYSSHNGAIDPEFARAKAIKHSLKKLGTNMAEGIIRHQAVTGAVIDPTIAKAEAGENDNEANFDTYEEMPSTPEAANVAEPEKSQINSININDL